MSALEVSEGSAGSEHAGVRVFCVAACDAQQLADRIALILGEHMAADDDLHLSYGAVQSGWDQQPVPVRRRDRSAHTQLFFEYSALLVLRAPAA